MLLRVFLYVLVVIAPLIIKLTANPKAPLGLIFEVGKGMALTAFAILCLQFVLAARLKWIERPFGLDRIFQFHKRMAVCAMVLLLMHPLLIALGGPGLSFLISPGVPWYIWAARAALLFLLFQVLSSAFRRIFRLEFERWRLLHNILAPSILVLIFLHSWNAGSDLDLILMQLLWLPLFGGAIIFYIYHRALRPRQLRRTAYRVEQVEQETHDVWTVQLAPPKGKIRFDYYPGQFQFVTLYRDGRVPTEEHPFTISSTPTKMDAINLTIKESGDFTASISETKPGDTAVIHGPFGRFSYLLHPRENNFVFIAGGIGITPLMSMLRYMRDCNVDNQVLLLYANKTQKDIVFRNELSGMAAGEFPKLSVIHILSRENDWHGEKGYVDREKIERFCGTDLRKRAYYICGPSRMMSSVVKHLKTLGVPKARIHFEHFSL